MWPIRGNHFSLSLWPTCHSFCLSLSFSLISTREQVVSSSTIFVAIPSPEINTRRRRRKASSRRMFPPVVSVGDEQQWSSSWLLKFTPLPPFLPDSNAVQPLFPVKSPVLERAFDLLQNYTPLAGRIIIVEKPITIHTMPSTTFSGELGQFREVRPPKA